MSTIKNAHKSEILTGCGCDSTNGSYPWNLIKIIVGDQLCIFLTFTLIKCDHVYRNPVAYRGVAVS